VKIVHLANSLDPDAGGPPVVVSRLAAAQAALGHDVIILGGRAEDRDEHTRKFLNETPGIERVEICCTALHSQGLAGLLFGGETESELERLAPIDVLHLHGVWDPVLVRAAAWCRKRGVPYVLCPHGMLDDWSLQQGAAKKKFALAITHRALTRRAGTIHVLNEHEKTTIGRLGFGTRMDVIPNGIFIEEVDVVTKPREFRDSIEGLGDAPYALFLSRLHYKKGLDILADAWALACPDLPGVRLVIAGPRDDNSIDDFNQRIAKAGLTDSVFVVGPIYGTTKTSAYRDASVFVLPSRQEGFSMAITESLALGTPAVVSTECHYPDISEFDAGIETSLAPEDVADGLRKMFRDEVFSKQAAERGAKLVRERYTWPAIARQSISVYQQITSG